MLTAEKENNQLTARPVAQRPSTVRSFDRVVNSIDGLRERIQGFTLEEVSEVDERLREMSTRLGELRQTLSVLSEMKLQVGRLQNVVQQAESESLEQNRLVTQVEPIPAQAIAQVVNLLKFRQVIKLLKSANNVSGVSTSPDAQGKKPVLMEHVEVVPEHQKNEEEFVSALPAILTELPEISANENTVVVAGDALEEPEALIQSASAAMDFEPNEPFLNEPTDAIFFDDSTANIHAPEIDAEFGDTHDQPPPSHVIPEAEAPTLVKPNAAAAEEADFDHRLLDDLIKNYGEFYVSPSSSEKIEVSHEPKQETITSTPQAAPLTTVNATSQRNLPLQRENGELDRKLKKLIKDYGEYDLYSRQSPIKLKTSVVIAFLLMTLVFSGFYFFSSSKSTVSSSTSSASQPQSSPDTPSRETSKIADTSATENSSAPSVSSLDVPKTAEAEASPHLPNKVAPKKTR
ncbi:MAG TPA: hypothetical protein VN966_01980 [Candidatus Bathyarchaeia archaeon]|nr:hypothetical protein [Candidatus Bathyarchaeia archaeon]